jgi:hypothetical protein
MPGPMPTLAPGDAGRSTSYMQKASASAPHLRFLNHATPSPSVKIRVDVLEWSGGQLRSLSDWEPQTPEQFKDTIKNPPWRRRPPDGSTHLLITEDLSRDIIEVLGGEFQLNPEFFGTHLLDTQYAGLKIKSQELTPSLWPTASLDKDFISIRWSRPVWRRSDGACSFLWQKQVANFETNIGQFLYNLSFICNTVRFGWDLATHAGHPSRISIPSQNDVLDIPVAWEEKATIHSQNVDGGRLSRCTRVLVKFQQPDLYF